MNVDAPCRRGKRHGAPHTGETMILTDRHHRRLPHRAGGPLPRRGVLLLIVLSLLTLFMMLGTTYMVVTSRAKATARAFARAAAGQQAAGDAAGRRLVEDAFRILARGTTNVACQEQTLLSGDDLLGDKYGRTLPGLNVRGRYAQIAQVDDVLGGPNRNASCGLLQLTLANPLNLSPAQAQGRVVTITLPGMCLSRRVLRAEGSLQETTGLVIAAVSPVDESTLTAADLDHGVALTAGDPNAIHLVFNGREFVGDPGNPPTAGYPDSNEPFDGFGKIDPANMDPNAPVTDPYLACLIGTDDNDLPFDVYANRGAPDASIQPKISVRKMSFFGVETDLDNPTNRPEVDNDADGVLDSRWIDVGFPVMRTDDGTHFRARPAYLVLDLDARLNLNAHGSRFQLDALLTSAGGAAPPLAWPMQGGNLPPGLTDADFNDLPFGSGYGPAEVRLWDLFFATPGYLPDDPNDVNVTARTDAFLFGSQLAEMSSLANQKRPLLNLTQLPGRFGYGPPQNNQPATVSPGEPGMNDPLSMIRDEQRFPFPVNQQLPRFPKAINDSWRAGITPAQLESAPDLYASPSDLSGRMKIAADSDPWGDGLVSRMWYVKPQNFWRGDATDDPYEIRLARPSAFDKPFLPDELERVLRGYDWDASQLPVRLSALLGADAERLRLLLTTDSWDTTAIVGNTWQQIENALVNRSFDPALLADLLGPEVASGRRLDLNRQVSINDGSEAARREAFCRHLYTLLWTLIAESDANRPPPTPEACQAIAQWAVNVLDFRDSDATMTRFVYDENPTDGWDPDPQNPPFVWGVERPEILITQALCWKNEDGNEGGVHVVLHRPWSAKALDGDTILPGNDLAPSPLDPDAVPADLAAREVVNGNPTGPLLNALDLGLLGGGDPESPVWRMRLGESPAAPIIRFDVVDPNATNPEAPQYSSDDPDPRARFVPPDRWICITGDRGTPAGQPVQIAGGLPQLLINQTDGLPGGPLPSSDAGETDQLIVLERLADPGLPHQPDPLVENHNPYIEVDRIDDVPVADRTERAPDTDEPRQYYASPTRSLNGTTTAVFWQQEFDPATLMSVTDPAGYDATNDDQIEPLNAPGGRRVAWMPWLNRPFVSPAELVFVPTTSPDLLLELYPDFTGNGRLDDLAAELGIGADILVNDIFQSTTVPSRYADLATSVANPSAFENTGTGLEWLAVNQLESWREPGRVNLNTVSDDRVWDATVRRVPRPASVVSPPGDGLDRSEAGFGVPADPTAPPPSPAETLLDLWGLDAGTSSVVTDDTNTPGQEFAANPQFSSLTASRLANVATNRSNVFAIWVTVGFFECDPAGNFVMIPDPADNTKTVPKELGSDTGSVKRHRGFYVFDRSIPVGYVTGRDLNLEDAVRLRRIMQ